MGLTQPDAWIICTLIVCATVLAIYFTNVWSDNRGRR